MVQVQVQPKLQKQKVPHVSGVTTWRTHLFSRNVISSLAAIVVCWKLAKEFTTNQNDGNLIIPSTTHLPPWKEGYLDIHHIHAGVNVATFMIFPDGTTMLIDCGDLDIDTWKKKFGKPTAKYPKLDVISQYPNQSKTTGQWVIDYINHFWPHTHDTTEVAIEDTTTDRPKVIDFMMVTHFHQDHIGSIYTNRKQKKGTRGDYIRTGIVEVGDDIDFTTIIDRGYPKYDFPFDLEKDWESPHFLNYLKFVQTSLDRGSTKTAEQFQVGSYTQIGLRKTAAAQGSSNFDHFRVRNIKSNLEYSSATPENNSVKNIHGQLLYPAPKRRARYTYDENKLSTAIVVEYGKFRYYEGGDQDYHNDGNPRELQKYELDTVTPTTQMAGPVHVATLNYHGHGVLKVFCDVMSPRVLILQGWCSDHPPNHSMETLLRQKKPADLFTTWVSDDRLNELYKQKRRLRDMFKSTVGHVVVRVEPMSTTTNDNIINQQKYHVYILDGNRDVKSYFGPYMA